MANNFNPIDAFVGTGTGAKRLVFRTAYTWSRDEVIAFLKDASDNPGLYGVPDWQARQQDLKDIYKCIESLKPPIYNAQGNVTSPGGVSFDNPTPEQQVLRTRTNPRPTDPIAWATTNEKKSFWIIFDLLGVFLSLLGPAPTNATRTNYFLPLVVIYARWCIVLSPGPALAPTVAQITWVTKSNRLYPFLGASAKGFATGRVWPDLVKRKRHCVTSDILKLPYTAYGDSPMYDFEGKPGWNLGNCGETFPFLYLLTDATVKNTCLGIALTVGATASDSTKPQTQHPNVYDGQQYWRIGRIKPPCENCETLLQWFGLQSRLPYFKLYTNPT